MTQPTPKNAGVLRKLYTLLGIVALVLGVLSTGWLIVMVDQWLVPWSSLAVMAPPGAPPPGAPPAAH